VQQDVINVIFVNYSLLHVRYVAAVVDSF